MTIAEVNDSIDRLLHDAEHAVSGAVFAASIGHVAPANEMHQKARRLKAEADKLYLDNPGSFWPECEWPAPKPSCCEHERLNEDGICRRCGADCRGIY